MKLILYNREGKTFAEIHLPGFRRGFESTPKPLAEGLPPADTSTILEVLTTSSAFFASPLLGFLAFEYFKDERNNEDTRRKNQPETLPPPKTEPLQISLSKEERRSKVENTVKRTAARHGKYYLERLLNSTVWAQEISGGDVELLLDAVKEGIDISNSVNEHLKARFASLITDLIEAAKHRRAWSPSKDLQITIETLLRHFIMKIDYKDMEKLFFKCDWGGMVTGDWEAYMRQYLKAHLKEYDAVPEEIRKLLETTKTG